MSPTDIQMAAPLFIEAFREAERQGYDAVVPLGMLDLGIDGLGTLWRSVDEP